MGDLLEADVYNVVEVLESEVKMHANVQKYRDCCCDPNVGKMGREDLMVTLAPDTNTSNMVVVVINTKGYGGLEN